MDLEEGQAYDVEKKTVTMVAGDNLLLTSITVYLDDYKKAYKTWDSEEIAQIIAQGGEFAFDIAGDSTKAHKVKIVCFDAAGNETLEEITGFYVTTNALVVFYSNKPLFFGSIAGIVLIIIFIFFLIFKRRKKEEEETQTN